MNAFFKECEIVEHRQADDFKHRFGVDLERVPQGINVVGDFFVLAATDFTRPLEIAIEDSLVGRRIEFKNDRASVNTGNLFLEFEQLFKTCSVGRALAQSRENPLTPA
mgnify:CR=1 FL=1